MKSIFETLYSYANTPINGSYSFIVIMLNQDFLFQFNLIFIIHSLFSICHLILRLVDELEPCIHCFQKFCKEVCYRLVTCSKARVRHQHYFAVFRRRYESPCWFVEKTQIVWPTQTFEHHSKQIGTLVASAFTACTSATASSLGSTFVVATAAGAVGCFLSLKCSPAIDLAYFLIHCCYQSCFVAAASRASAVATSNSCSLAVVEPERLGIVLGQLESGFVNQIPIVH